MKKNLLNKMAKAASVALVAGAMVCGASLTANTTASANGVPGLSTSESAHLSHFGEKKANSVLNAYNNTYTKTHSNKKAGKAAHVAYEKLIAHKSGKKVARKANKAAKHEEKGIRAGKYNSHKLGAVKRSNKKAHKHVAKKTVRRNHAKRVAKRVNKKSVKKVNKRARKSVRRNRQARRANRRVVRHVVKPMNRRAYRHEQVRRGTKNFRKTAYYHKVWTHAEKVNKKGMNFDLRAAKFDQKKGYKRAAKNALYHAHKLNWWVNHDAQMLNLAK